MPESEPPVAIAQSAVAAALWGTDALLRSSLAEQVSASTIVFAEHVVLTLVLLPFLWLQPKPDGQPYRANVDVGQEAAFVADQAPFTPAAPTLPEGWSANYARWTENSEDGVPLWNVGYLSPEYHLVDLAQTAESNPTWLAQRTQLIPPTDERTVNGITWQIHHRDASGKQDEFTAWVGELKDSTVVLSGQAPSAEFEHVAGAVSGQ